jgi:hypothetical protein
MSCVCFPRKARKTQKYMFRKLLLLAFPLRTVHCRLPLFLSRKARKTQKYMFRKLLLPAFARCELYTAACRCFSRGKRGKYRSICLGSDCCTPCSLRTVHYRLPLFLSLKARKYIFRKLLLHALPTAGCQLPIAFQRPTSPAPWFYRVVFPAAG